MPHGAMMLPDARRPILERLLAMTPKEEKPDPKLCSAAKPRCRCGHEGQKAGFWEEGCLRFVFFYLSPHYSRTPPYYRVYASLSVFYSRSPPVKNTCSYLTPPSYDPSQVECRLRA